MRLSLAPLAVVFVLNGVVQQTAYADDIYWLLHFLGGAALAYLFFRLPALARAGTWRHAVAFAFACTGALAWELAEFAADRLLGTSLQRGLVDTMSDLLFSVSGAALVLACAAAAASEWRAPGVR